MKFLNFCEIVEKFFYIDKARMLITFNGKMFNLELHKDKYLIELGIKENL